MSYVDEGVVVVGSTDETASEYKAYYSNFGNRVDIYAPGTNIISAVYDNTAATEFGSVVNDPRNSDYKLSSISGTSMASPQVCGVLACYAEQNPNLNSYEALDYLIATSKKNQINSIGVDYSDTSWFGDNGNNRYLFYKLERPLSGQSLPRIDQPQVQYTQDLKLKEHNNGAVNDKTSNQRRCNS